MNVDRIGIGKSSHPLSLQITIPGQAFAMHQLVTKLRSGVLGTAFDRIIIMGHSMGSAVAETEAAAYDDVDAVIATGLGTRKNGVGLAQLFATFVPAFTQSRFAGKGLDAGYLSTMVGTRGNSFYYKPNADPAVIAEDDATREPVTATELGTIAPVVVPGVAAPVTVPVCAASIPLCVSPLLGIIRGPSADIRVPSLFVLGQKDALICGGSGTDCSSAEAVKAQETPFWGTDCLGVRLVPDAGHDLSLQRNAPDWYATVAAWVHDFEARGGGCPGPIPGVA
jgi:pimeloyl-ACP methyl ester carboxylesterase